MKIRCVLLCLFVAAPAFAEQGTAPATLELNGAFLAQMKAHPQPAIVNAVRMEADRAMKSGPYSVMDKQDVPPSGSKHDYVSMAPYWWPNPETKSGLPFVRKDGQVNPARYKFPDDREFNEMRNAVHALALGYYFTGNAAYARRAVLLLRRWFLNPATRMNPNLNFAQAVPGVNTGRGTGLIEVREIPRLLDAITLLERSPAMTKTDREGLRKWFTEYLRWLETSRNGQEEAAAKNNHGSWYDQQLVGIALFLGNRDLARQTAETAETKRIALQIEADGSEPLELTRTKSFSYSVFNLDALMRLAQEADHVGVDLWTYRAPDGASIRAALDYLVPFAEKKKQWTHEAINGVDASLLTEPLLLAAIHYKDANYLQLAEQFEKSPDLRTRLLMTEARQMLGRTGQGSGAAPGRQADLRATQPLPKVRRMAMTACEFEPSGKVLQRSSLPTVWKHRGVLLNDGGYLAPIV
ncbi:MAG TPA: alginate lyase family protein [Terracidiphilus sp.]|nr:alginate lyase family protein [Terracidiphilus sp.]